MIFPVLVRRFSPHGIFTGILSMRFIQFFGACLAAALPLVMTSPVFAHGTPIVVTTPGGKLSTDKSFYANLTEDDAIDGKLFPSGSFYTNNLPGLDIVTMTPGEVIGLELLPRTLDGSAATSRYLWYWQNSTVGVTLAPTGTTLRIDSTRSFESAFDSITVGQNGIDPGALTIGAVIPTDINAHRHMLNYFVTQQPGLTDGVFGVYARLTSPSYESSDPFWMFFNLTEDYLQVTEGTSAIMSAAQPIAVPEPGIIVFLALGVGLGAGRLLRKRFRREMNQEITPLAT